MQRPRPGDLEHRRGHVDVRHQRAANLARRDPQGIAQDEGDADAPFEKVPLGEPAVVARHLAVVGEKDDERIVQRASSFQRADNLTHPVVDLGDLAVVGGADFADLLVGQLRQIPLGLVHA